MRPLLLLACICFLVIHSIAQIESANSDQKLKDSSLKSSFVIATTSTDSISFDMHFLPTHKYTQTVKRESKISLTYSGSDSVLNTLKKRGIANPMEDDKLLHVSSTITTGDLNENHEMPVQLIFGRSYTGQGKLIFPEGTGMIGKVREDNMPTFDLLILKDPNDSATKSALNSMKKIFSQVTLPASKMKVGDTQVKTTPVSIPAGPVTMKMIISIAYKLTKVTDSVAFFDLSINAKLDITGLDADTTVHKFGSGSGTRKLMFDRLNNYPLKEDQHIEMEMGVVFKGIGIDVKLISDSKHNISISKL